MIQKHSRKFVALIAGALTLALLSGCAAFGNFGDEVTRAFKGMEATMTTYNQDGQQMDTVKGKSFNVSRDDRFDSTDSDGTSNSDSKVLLVSLGDSHISHVGSTMILAQEGLQDNYLEGEGYQDLENADPGTPWLNNFIEKNRNLWDGKAKTLMIRSQDGDPIAIYAGDSVEVFSTDVPSSTMFRVDDKSLFVYRADYTMFDTDLIDG